MKPWLCPVPNPSISELEWPEILVLAATILGEAEGETVFGKLAVAWVIRNRVEAPKRWRATYAGVCLQPRQFSCWGDLNRSPVMYRPKRHVQQSIWTDCFRAAASVMLLQDAVDPTGRADHYLATWLAESKPPKWHDPSKVTAVIGNHTFLKL